jgi:uncharacterized protein (DUF1330 family)
MADYLIGHISVKDQAQWATYVEGVRKSLLPFDAQVLFRGRRAAVLAGEHPYDLAVVIQFHDHDTLQKWFLSADYQALIPLRDRAADVVIVTYEE